MAQILLNTKQTRQVCNNWNQTAAKSTHYCRKYTFLFYMCIFFFLSLWAQMIVRLRLIFVSVSFISSFHAEEEMTSYFNTNRWENGCGLCSHFYYGHTDNVFLAHSFWANMHAHMHTHTHTHTYRLAPACSDWFPTFGTVAPGPGQAAETSGSVFAGLRNTVVDQQLAALPFITWATQFVIRLPDFFHYIWWNAAESAVFK